MIKAIIFDYDGVIVDSFPVVYSVYKTVMNEIGKECPATIEEFRKAYGYNSAELAQNLGLSDEDKVQVEKIFKQEILKKQPELFTGISEVLDELHKKYKLVVISTNHKEEVMQKLENYGITKYFDVIIGTRTPQGRMPKTQAMTDVMKELGVTQDEIIMIGDRDVDHDDSAAAGLKHIVLVEYGWGYTRDKYPQKVIVEKPLDIIKAVQAIDS
jgi:HAD superfamily hydrolase (TIGR01549 family)